MKCRYNHCQLGGEVSREEAVKVGKCYYHQECYEEKELKAKIVQNYYDQFQTKEPIQAVRKAINKYIHEDDFAPHFILFVLNEDIKLNSMFGLIYYLNYPIFHEKYNKLQARLTTFDADRVSTQSTSTIKYQQRQRQKWGDIICQ